MNESSKSENRYAVFMMMHASNAGQFHEPSRNRLHDVLAS